MTVEQAIKELQKIEDKTVQIFTDCPKCGQANAIRKLDLVVVVRAKGTQTR
jgi:hypothetical protein